MTAARRTEAAWALAAALLSTLIAAWVLRLWDTSLSLPWTYSFDGFQNLGAIKAVLDHAWYLDNPDLGAPFGADWHDRPFPSTDGLLIAKLLSVAVGSPFTAANLLLLFSFAAVGAAAYLVMHALGAARGPALVCAVLYTLLPYHFLKGEQQLFNACYWTVPLAAYLMLRLAAGEPLFATRRQTLGTLALCIAIGLSSPYYTVFAILLVLVAGGLRALADRRVGALRPALAVLAALVVVTAINQAPVVVFHARHGGNDVVANPPVDSEIFALKLDDMVFPARGHRVGPLRDLTERYFTQTQTRGEASGTLGLVGVVGFAWLLVVALAGAFSRSGPGGDRERHAAALTVAAFGIATLGGVSALIAWTVSPTIRSWGRMSVVIAFLALLAVALLLSRVRSRRPAAIAGLAVLLLVGVLDQTTRGVAPDYAALTAQYRSDAGFVHQVEGKLPRGAMLLTLPYEDYPESRHTWAEGDYQHLRPYLSSSRLRFSYGAMRGRPQDWHGALQDVPLRTLLDGAAAAGFAGVWVDTAAFADGGAALVGSLDGLLGPGLGSSDARLRFWDLRPYADERRSQLGADRVREQADATLRPVRTSYAAGFYGPEGVGADRWHWGGQHAELALDNPGPERTLRLSALLRTDAPVPGTVSLTLPEGRVQRVRLDEEGTRVRLNLTAPSGRSVISFDTDAPAVLPADGRRLFVQVRNAVVLDARMCRSSGRACTDGPRPQLP